MILSCSVSSIIYRLLSLEKVVNYLTVRLFCLQVTFRSHIYISITYQYSDWFRIVVGELGTWGAETIKLHVAMGGGLGFCGWEAQPNQHGDRLL